VDIVTEQDAVQVVNVVVLGKHNVAGEVELKAVDVQRAAPAADALALLQQNGIFV